MNSLLKDLSYSTRVLAKKPGFTIVALFTLALGIGANTAIFSVVNALLLNPLPFPELDRLVAIWERIPSQNVERNETATANYVDWKAENQSFENMAIYAWWNANISGIDPPERVQGFLVTTNLLDTLKVQPILGRNFTPEEGEPGKDQVVILSYGLWQRRFGGDPDILNKTISVNGITRTIIGVMPEGYNFPKGVDVLAPYAPTPAQASNRRSHSYLTIARLKDGVSIEQAQADMDTIAARLEQQYPQTNTGRGVVVYTLLEDTVRYYQSILSILLLAVAFVLAVACANVANLLLARAAGRKKEIAVRLALGASRWRIIRQLITESVLLSLAGGTLGVLLALWGMQVLKASVPPETVRYVIGWSNIRIDFVVLGYTIGLSFIVGLIFGLAPAIQSSKPDLNEALKEAGGKNVSGGRERLRSVLVVSEVALSLLLLVGAGMAMKSFWQLLKTNPGFNTENIFTMNLTLPRIKYSDDAKQVNFYQELTRRVESLPGVESVGMINYLPLAGSNSSSPFIVEGLPEPPPGQEFNGRYRASTPGYFKTMGITILSGRDFTEQDTANSQPVAIINETMARQYWTDGDALGKRFRSVGPIAQNPWYTIVGIIKDAKFELYSPVTPEYYFPIMQDTWGTMVLVASTRTEPMALSSAIRGEVAAMDKDLPLFSIKTMEQVRSQSVLPYSASGILLSVFASVALILAAVGIYGVMSYSVTQRTREIGIRMALGAKQEDVLKMVVRHGLMLTIIGLGIGLLGSWFLMQSVANLLFGVSASDLTIFISVPLLLTAVAFIACYVPARRAARVDPMIALRHE